MWIDSAIATYVYLQTEIKQGCLLKNKQPYTLYYLSNNSFCKVNKYNFTESKIVKYSLHIT